MIFEKYQEACRRTLSQDIRKLTSEEKQGIVAILRNGIDDSFILDDLKKWIFYKKESKRVVINLGEEIEKTDLQNSGRFDLAGKNMNILHAILGLITESFELLDGYLNGIDSNMAEEIGDIEWYRSILFSELNLTTDEVWNKNIMKLQKRYKEKFTQEEAINRDTHNELTHYE